MVLFAFSILDRKDLFWSNYVQKNQCSQFQVKCGTYDPGHIILELYNILVKIRFTTSKTKHDI